MTCFIHAEHETSETRKDEKETETSKGKQTTGMIPHARRKEKISQKKKIVSSVMSLAVLQRSAPPLGQLCFDVHVHEISLMCLSIAAALLVRLLAPYFFF